MTVSPTNTRLLVHAYVDGELDPAHAVEIEQQEVSGDPALAAERDRVEALRRAIRERLPLEAAPADLARRIETAVGLRRDDARTSSHPSWRALAASGRARGIPGERRDLACVAAPPRPTPPRT